MTQRDRRRQAPDTATGNAIIRTTSPPQIAFSNNTTYVPWKEHCVDHVDGTRNDHPLDIDYREVKIIPDNKGYGTNGHYEQGGRIWDFQNHVAQYHQIGSMSHINLSTIPDLGTKTLARTNPSRPLINVPLVIGELKDLPGLFQVGGKTLLKKGANAFLSYQYGWRPFLKDLISFTKVKDEIHKKELELNDLYSGDGRRYRVTIDHRTATDTLDKVTMYPIYGNMDIRMHALRTTERHIWGTTRWRPLSKPPLGDGDMHRLATNVALGFADSVQDWLEGGHRGAFTVASNLWDIMPFSWLTSWFSGFTDFVHASRNTIPAGYTLPCIMTETTTTYRWTEDENPLVQNFIHQSPVQYLYRTRQRRIGVATTVSAAIPALSGLQLSILGALGIQRLRGLS